MTSGARLQINDFTHLRIVFIIIVWSMLKKSVGRRHSLLIVYLTNRLRLGILLPKRCRNLSNSAIVSFENL